MDREEFLKQTYEVSSLNERDKINKEYEYVEKLINDFYVGKETLENTSNKLGEVVLEFKGEHSSTQLYAFEMLFKMLSEVNFDDKENVKTVLSEILFDVSVTTHPIKREYLLGILQYYVDKNRLEEINRKMMAGIKNAQLGWESQIITNIYSVIGELKRDDLFNDPLFATVIKYIIDDFPEDNPECESARLIAKYYEMANLAAASDLSGKTPTATGKPGIPKKLFELIEEDNKSRGGSDIIGIPYKIVCLDSKHNHHPSQKKLDEADDWDIKLSPFIVFPEDIQKPIPEGVIRAGKKYYVEYDISPKLTRLYLRRIRYYKDKNQLEKVRKLENAFNERIWRNISEHFPEVARQIGDKENMVVIKRTIRDYPIDKILAGEKEFEELIEKLI